MSKAKMTYDELILKLRDNTYTAPDRWMRVEDELKINDQLQNLKTYSAPEGIWGKIEDGLAEKPIIQINKKRSYYKLVTVGLVASVIVLVGYFNQINTDHAMNISYTSTIVVETSINVKPNEESDLTEALDLIDRNDFLFTAKDRMLYKTQLQELDEAKAEIKTIQEMYGIDMSTKKMLAKIEREKTKLIKSMIKEVG